MIKNETPQATDYYVDSSVIPHKTNCLKDIIFQKRGQGTTLYLTAQISQINIQRTRYNAYNVDYNIRPAYNKDDRRKFYQQIQLSDLSYKKGRGAHD